MTTNYLRRITCGRLSWPRARVLLALLTLMLVSPAAAQESGAVHVLTFDGPVNPLLVSYIERGLQQATDHQAAALVLRLDTPGGQVDLTQDIIKLLRGAPLPVIVYVWPTGAMAGSFAATDGRTFTAPPEGWTLGTWPNRASHYAGSPETLAGDLIREGVTGVSAHVADPFLDGAVRPQVLLPAYASGFSLAEAYYLAMPFLSWQTLVIGDPLVRPFPRREADATAAGPVATAEPPAPGRPPVASRQPPADEIDPATELPRLFAARRLATPQAGRLDRKGLELALRGESRLARGDEAGAYEAFEQAVAAEPRLFQTQYLLTERDERAQEWARAESRYRAVLELDGNQVVALNNLAYLLAERLARPGDALPLARRAYTLSNGTAVVADTLGWTYYRLGDLAQASRYIAEAVRGAPDLAEVRLHAAAVAVGTGQLDLASRELTRALELDPSLDGHPLTAELRAALAATPR